MRVPINRNTRKGMTLAEILIVSGLFFLITYFTWSQIQSSFKALEKSQSDSFRLLAIKKLNRTLEREIKSSDVTVTKIVPSKYTLNGAEHKNYSIVFLSSVNDKGAYELDDNDNPKWLRKCVFYLDPATSSVYIQQIPQPSPSSVKKRPDGSFTPLPIKDSCVAKGITDLYFTDDKEKEECAIPVGDHIICMITGKGDKGFIHSRIKVAARISKNY